VSVLWTPKPAASTDRTDCRSGVQSTRHHDARGNCLGPRRICVERAARAVAVHLGVLDRPHRTYAAKSAVLITRRNTYALGFQARESMACKFPLTDVKNSVAANALNVCGNCLRAIIFGEFAAPTGAPIRGRPSCSRLGENLYCIAPSKWHFLREMAGEAYSNSGVVRLGNASARGLIVYADPALRS
jgi:hypothetical protein